MLLRYLLLTCALSLLLPCGAEAQTHSLTASATVVEPVRADAELQAVVGSDGRGGPEVRAPRGGRHIVTVRTAPLEPRAEAGERILVRDAAGEARLVSPERVRLREEEVREGDRLQVTYIVAVDA